MKEKKQKKKWLRFRHHVVRHLLSVTLGVYTRFKYHIKVEKHHDKRKRPYLILLNHQTAGDQFFVGMAFRSPIYYLASEDLFSMGFTSSLIRWLVAPIPIKKQTTDVRAIMNCLRVAREGGTIAIAPEGNRTYSGRTEYMSPSIAPLARKMRLPIALFRIEGGYGKHPRWSDVVRKGRMHAYVSRVIEPEEYAAMTDDELFSVIREGLYVDEAVADACFPHKKSAEYLERALYVCPKCGLADLQSKGEIIRCTKCGTAARYLPTKELCGVGGEFPFRFVADWYDHQTAFISELSLDSYLQHPAFVDKVSLLRVIPYEKKELLAKSVTMELYGDRITLTVNGETTVHAFEELHAVTVLGKNKLNLYVGEDIYQVQGEKRFNALKYVHFYNHYLNAKKGEEHGTFLGL